MENVTSNFTDGGLQLTPLSTKSSEEILTTDITQIITTSTSRTLVTDLWGLTTLFEENVSGSSVRMNTFYDTEFNINNGTQSTLYPTEVVEALSLDTVQIIIAVASAVFSFITVLGNLLVLYAFYAERRLRTYTNYYIVGLSFSDLVAGAFTMPMYSIYWVLGYWPFWPILCDIYLYLNHVFIHISVLAILVLAVDRYQAVSQPLRHLQMRTLSHASFMIALAYLIPFLIWLPYTILWPYIVGERRIIPGRCIPQYVLDSLFFSILAPVCFFWIPLPITSVLYWRIYVVIRSKKKQRKGPVMMQELSTSTSSRAPMVGDEVPNISGKASSHDPSPKQPTNDAAKPQDNDNNANELGHENLGFEQNEEEKYGNTENKPSVTPNSSHLHSRPNQPILNPNIQQKTDQANSSKGTQQQKQMAQQSSMKTKKDRESKKESNRAERTLTLIFIVLLVSSVPWSILVIIRCLCPTCLPLVLYQTSVFLGHMNSTVNPFCYAIANPLYMDAFMKLVCCGRRRTKRRGRQPATRRMR